MEKLKNFENPRQLLEWLVNANEINRYYFRGISKDEHKYPSIMRHHDDDLSFVEDHILREFSKYGCSLVGNITNAFDYVSYAQHFGLPTRLVDWTRNPFVALFFAVYYANKDNTCDPRILCLPHSKTIEMHEPAHIVKDRELFISSNNAVRDYRKFIQQVEGGLISEICIAFANSHENMNVSAGYSETINNKNKNGYMITIDTGYSNARLLAQDGLFYLPRKLEKTKIDSEYSASDVQYISIPLEWRETILQALERIGVTKYKLFFDLETICKYVVEKVTSSIENLERGLEYSDNHED